MIKLEPEEKLSEKETNIQNCTYPADSISEADMTVSEVRRTPAVYGFSVVLFGRQQDREHNEQCGCISNNERIV